MTNKCFPRPDREPAAAVKFIREPWTLEMCIFKVYFKETKELFEECFHADYAQVKVPKLKQSKPFEVENTCAKYYPLIREVYKFHAGMGTNAAVFSVPLNQYSMLLNEVNLIDPATFSTADADRMFIAVNAGINKPLNPQHALVRYQFLEILIKIAIEKYFKNNIVKSEIEALEKLFYDHLAKHYSKVN